MPNTEKNEVTEVTIHQFENELATWLDGFNFDLTNYEKVQQNLHNSILILDEQLYTKAEKETIGVFLNSALSLTFLIKDNPSLTEQFINYRKK